VNPVKIGSVRFLNTRPLIEGLEVFPEISLHPAVPSKLAGMLLRAEVDIALVSVIDAARAPSGLTILPAGMIGSDGPTLTVRLFSAVPVQQITQVWADTDSHTSVLLCRVLLERLHGVRPTFRDFNAREQMPLGAPGTADAGGAPAVLLIGDKVVTDPPDPALYTTQIDLGQAWKQWTGLPFVYAAWMCRAVDADRPEIAVAAGVLDRQRRHNMTRLAAIALKHAPAAGWPVELATRYLSEHLRFDLGPREREAAQRFIDEAAAIGAIGPARLQWIDWRPAALHAAAAGPRA